MLDLSTPSLGITQLELEDKQIAATEELLSTSSLGITRERRRPRDAQDEKQRLSTPSLGITLERKNEEGCHDRPFQLPLSGSRMLLSSSASACTYFNSLSRDHDAHPRRHDRGSVPAISTPSLGITSLSSVWFDYYVYGTEFQLPLSGSHSQKLDEKSFALVTINFNSLSRDHEFLEDLVDELWIYYLSTPSLGITYQVRAHGYQA